MQAQGSLRDTNLATLLQTMQSERATGTLSLEDSEQCALYFLFGHLFHAAGASGQGEDVVINALAWSDGTFRFDPRAKLPAEETIKSPPADLITRAERRQREAAATGAASSAAVSSGARSGGDGVASGRTDPFPTRSPVVPEPEPAAPSAVHEELPEPLVETEAPVEYGADVIEAPIPAAASSSTPEAAPWSPPADVEPVPSPEPAQPEPALVASPAAHSSQPEPGPRPVPSPVEERAVGGAPDAPPLEGLYPLPAGKNQYEGLKSAFVDFPKLLRTLKSDQHTGYVRLHDADYSGSLLMHQGDLLEALSSNGGVCEGEAAFLKFRRHMDDGSGLIDVIELPPDTVIALAQLLTARPLFAGLLGRFVDFSALLEYLAEEKVDGSVVVASGRETGVILLRGGVVLGAYTGDSRELDTKTNLVAALAKEPPARIEVKSGAVDIERMDFEASLNQPY